LNRNRERVDAVSPKRDMIGFGPPIPKFTLIGPGTMIEAV